jgi:hypothetical protein
MNSQKVTSQNFNFTNRIFNSNCVEFLSFLFSGRLGEIVRGRHQPRHLSAWLDVISQMRQKRKRNWITQGTFFFFNPKERKKDPSDVGQGEKKHSGSVTDAEQMQTPLKFPPHHHHHPQSRIKTHTRKNERTKELVGSHRFYFQRFSFFG